MKKDNHHSGLVMKAPLIIVLALASVLAFLLYHVIVSPKADVYGINEGVNVSVQVGPASCSAPSIDDIGPLTGPTSGGTEVAIIGDNLNCVDQVTISGGQKCQPLVHVDNTKLKCTMPPHAEGYVDVVVRSPGIGESTKSNGFRYLGNAPKPPDSGGNTDNGGGPLVPNTGLFRLGKQIVTLYDVLVLAAAMVICAAALWLVVWKRRRHETDKRT
jgi:hypothetical protein